MLKMENLCRCINRKFFETAKEAEYGNAHVLVEDMAELTKEFMHYYHRPERTDGSMNKIIEELSHVLISCRCFQMGARISDDQIQAEIDKKYRKFNLAPEA